MTTYGEISAVDPSPPEAGDIVLIIGGPNAAFLNCLAVVDKVFNTWGVQCYVQSLGHDRFESGAQAYIRLEPGAFLATGGKVPLEFRS